MIALGFDLNRLSGNAALHEAVLSEDVGIARLLLDAGADPTLRDMSYHATPMGYALHTENAAMIALFDGCRMDIFTAAARGNLDQMRARLAEDRTRLDQRFAEICPGDVPQESGWTTPLVFAVANNHPDAVRLLLEAGADRSVTDGKGATLSSIAEAQAGPEVQAVLAEYG